nr:4623_t:CDS:2 [Entrophospora candida]
MEINDPAAITYDAPIVSYVVDLYNMEIIKPSFRKILESYHNHILTNSIYKEYKNSKMTQFLKNLLDVNNFQKIYHNNKYFCSLAEVINLLDKDNDDGDIDDYNKLVRFGVDSKIRFLNHLLTISKSYLIENLKDALKLPVLLIQWKELEMEIFLFSQVGCMKDNDTGDLLPIGHVAKLDTIQYSFEMPETSYFLPALLKKFTTLGKMLKEIKNKYENHINNAYQHEFERGFLTPECNVSDIPSELVHAHMLNLSLSPNSNDDNNTRNFNNNGASISQQPQQPITFVFERFCPGGLSKSNNNSIHNTNVVTQTNDKRNKKNNKRKQVSSSSTTSSISSSSYRLPINIDSPVSLNSSNREDDSKSESEYDDNMDICRSEVCSEYDMEESAVEGLKRLLMKFTAMTPTRLQSILSILLDNDIDDADILLLIDNEQFLHTLRGKNGSEISRGNCLLLWHGIQEYRNYYYSTTTTLHHTPKSFSSSCSSITSSSSVSSISSSSSYYSPPPSSSASSFSSMLSSSSPSSSRAITKIRSSSSPPSPPSYK